MVGEWPAISPCDDSSRFSTATSSLVTDLLEDEATIGSAVEWDSLRLEVEEVEDGRATRVLVSRVPSDA